MSGPAPAWLDPLSGDVQDINVVFQLPGTYELLLEVTDGPLGTAMEEGKKTEFRLAVKVVRPLEGDIDFTGTVDFFDVKILAGQWRIT